MLGFDALCGLALCSLPDAAIVTVPSAGGHGGKRYPRRILVEIDGETFEVRTEADAHALLSDAREMAERSATVAAQKAALKASQAAKPQAKARAEIIKVPKLAVIDPGYTDAFVQQVRAQVEAAQAAIADIYKRALREEMVARQDEDDVITLLLLG